MTKIVPRCLLVLIAAIGCGRGRVELPKAPVAGRVLYQDRPLNTGKILFIHESGQAVAAEIDTNGDFNMAAYQGMNQVAIACYEPDPPNSNPQARLALFTRKSLVPDRYASGSRSGLSCEVKPVESNQAEFRLTD